MWRRLRRRLGYLKTGRVSGSLFLVLCYWKTLDLGAGRQGAKQDTILFHFLSERRRRDWKKEFNLSASIFLPERGFRFSA
jgi:hypothetical protein